MHTLIRTLTRTAATLRGYQQECIDAVVDAFKQGVRRQVVSMPVGSGKTVIFSHLIPKVPSPSPTATKTLVLAHRTELLEQAFNRIRLTNPDLRSCIAIGKHKVDPNADVIVASVPTLGRAGSKHLEQLNASEYKLVIIDEAHHATASTYLRILDHFGVRSDNSHVMLFGCSATVTRHDGVKLEAVFDKVTFERSILHMWRDGWLCPLKARKVKTTVSIAAVPVVGGDFQVSKLSDELNTPERNKAIVQAWKHHTQNLSDPRYSTLVFAVDVAHANSLRDEFIAAGYLAHSVDGNTPKDTRADILEQFRFRQFPVLVNCAVFTEGTDIPCIDTLVMARPTRSSVLFQQMMGRGLRLHDGKKDCLIIDIVDNLGRNTVVTTPSLMGLDPEFDCAGEDILGVHKKVKELSEVKQNTT